LGFDEVSRKEENVFIVGGVGDASQNEIVFRAIAGCCWLASVPTSDVMGGSVRWLQSQDCTCNLYYAAQALIVVDAEIFVDVDDLG
jgi:hypothetical protein